MALFSAFEFLNKGGWVAWVLAVLSLVLWYAIGYRFLFLRSEYLSTHPKSMLRKKELNLEDLLGNSLSRAKDSLSQIKNDLETALEFELRNLCQKIAVHRQTIRAIVIVSPLLGLLGTVIGMIETFDSLQDSALFSQSGGIAGGISQALITTQLGLVVAIPGLLIGKKLDKKEQDIKTYMERFVSLALLEEETHEVQS